MQLPQRKPDQTFDLRLAGPVPPYTWTINGQVYDPTKDGLPVKPGQRVQVRYINESKMFHPMHLHGHTFQVMSNGRPMARKDTVLVPPLATVDTVFDTEQPRQVDRPLPQHLSPRVGHGGLLHVHVGVHPPRGAHFSRARDITTRWI